LTFRDLERAAARWARRLALLAGFLLVAVALVTVADALLRSLAGRPIQGTFEATELLLAVIVFVGLPYLGLTDGHVTVDLLTGRLGPRLQSLVMGLGSLLSAALLALIAVQLARLAGDYGRIGQTTITMRIPVTPFLIPVVFAAALAALASALHAAGAVARALRPRG
jgi:TRAP-type C4-dicarboxylate transport system permease small subunit